MKKRTDGEIGGTQGESTRISTLLLGVTACIGIISVPNYIRLIRTHVADRVVVIMTRNATRFITPFTFEVVSGNRAFVGSFDTTAEARIPHIELTGTADALLVMPASADIIARAARGVADDLLSTSILAARCPVLFVPSMNERMWLHEATQRNVKRLRELGYEYVEPVSGQEMSTLARTGGAMPPLQVIINALYRFINTYHGRS